MGEEENYFPGDWSIVFELEGASVIVQRLLNYPGAPGVEIQLLSDRDLVAVVFFMR